MSKRPAPQDQLGRDMTESRRRRANALETWAARVDSLALARVDTEKSLKVAGLAAGNLIEAEPDSPTSAPTHGNQKEDPKLDSAE